MKQDDVRLANDRKTPPEALLSVAKLVGINIPEDADKIDDKFYADFKAKAIGYFQNSREYMPRPLLKQKLSAEEWKELGANSNAMYQEFQERASVLIKRLDVTLESFLWSDRVKKLEPKVRAVYDPLKAALPLPHRLQPEDLIASTTDLLKIEKTSSASVRKGTKSAVTELTVRQKPVDRGGRTNEMMAPVRETFEQQQQQREQREQRESAQQQGRGGGAGGSNFGGARGGRQEGQYQQRGDGRGGGGRGGGGHGGGNYNYGSHNQADNKRYRY